MMNHGLMASGALGHTCYQELFDDPMHRPWINGEAMSDDILERYKAWTTVGDTVFSKDELLADLLLDMEGPFLGGVGVFLASTRSEGGVLHVLHNLRRHPDRDRHRGKTFAYAGDVCDGTSIDIVEFDTKLLEQTAPVIVPVSLDSHLAFFTADANRQVVPVLADGAPNTRAATTRQSMYIPLPLLPHLLGKDLTAREALITLAPLIHALNLQEACKPLLEFLQVATSRGTGDTPETLHTSIGSTPLGIAVVAASRLKSVLYTQLPALRPHNQNETNLQEIVGALNEVRDGVLRSTHDRRQEREDNKHPKTIAQRWKASTISRLNKMCGVASETLLPPIYHELAAHKKGVDGNVRTMLQDAVETAGHALGMRYPEVTVQHAQALAGWAFGGGFETLGEGLLPFTVTPPNQVSKRATEQIAADHQRNTDYTTIMDGSIAISASDANALRCEKGYIPTDWDEAEAQIEAYTPLLAAILGLQHPNVIEHKRAYDEMRLHKGALKRSITNAKGAKVSASLMVLHFHVRHQVWFKTQWSLSAATTRPPPRLAEGFETFAYGGYNLSWLPEYSHLTVLKRLAPSSGDIAHESQGAAPAPAPAPQARTSNRTSESTSRTGEHLRNNNQDSRFSGQTPMARRISAIKVKLAINRTNTPPPTINDKPRCLSWHLKGMCYSTCHRTYDHVVLKPDDADKLHTWCLEAYPEP